MILNEGHRSMQRLNSIWLSNQSPTYMLSDTEHDKPLYNRTYAHLDKALCIQDIIDRVPDFESRVYASLQRR